MRSLRFPIISLGIVNFPLAIGSESKWQVWQVFEIFLKPAKTCQNLPKPAKTCHAQSEAGAGKLSGLLIANAGTFRKSAGSGAMDMGVPFVNSGQITIQSGTMSLPSPLTFNLSGTFSGAVLLTYGTVTGTPHGWLDCQKVTRCQT